MTILLVKNGEVSPDDFIHYCVYLTGDRETRDINDASDH